MLATYDFLLDVTFLAVFLFLAALLKSKFNFLREWIIPTAMLAGIIGFLLGPEIIGLVSFNQDKLSVLVYHLMAIGFIAMGLKERSTNSNPGIMHSGIIIVSTYLVQGIVGLGIMMVLVGFFYPDLFQGVGLLLPLGFGQGPGQAYSIGSSWEALGITNGGNLGLTVAGIGFLWASFIGIIIINILKRNKKFNWKSVQREETEEENVVTTVKTKIDDTGEADIMDKMSFQFVIIGVLYLITYLTVLGVSKVLTPLGNLGQTMAELLIGFHFIIGSIYALGFRKLLDKMQTKGIHLEQKLDNGILSRISGTAFDIMITASIAAISVFALGEYAWPIIIFTTVGGFVTIAFMMWIVPKAFPEEAFPNILGFYGMLTGTISTGLALIKGVDSKFESNAADNLVLGSASGIALGAPMLLVLSIPVIGYRTGNTMMYWLTLAILIIYLLALLFLLNYQLKKKSN